MGLNVLELDAGYSNLFYIAQIIVVWYVQKQVTDTWYNVS